MPAVSKAQQKFFGIVRAIQKGEMAPTSPETAKAAAEMKKKDVKDFASTKHKGLPKKKLEEIHKQAHTPHEVPTGDLKKLVKKATKRIDTDADGDIDKNDKKKGELGEFIPGVGNKRLFSTTGTKTATEEKDVKDFASTKHKNLLDKVEVKEIYSGSDSGRAEKIKRYDAEKKKFAKDDKRKKFGKFVQDVEKVRSKSKGMRGTHKGKWGTFNKGVFTPDN
jgi:hypothetical protein